MNQTLVQPRCTVPQAAKQRAQRLCRGSECGCRSCGYTLIEVLVVAVVIVLMLGMALPVFHAITGSRSEAGASNIIAATLGRARTDAIGLQKTIGVAFLYNPSSQLSYMAEVEFPDCPVWQSPVPVPAQTMTPLSYVQVSIAGFTYYYIDNGTNPINPLSLNGPPATYMQNPQPGLSAVGGLPLEIRPDTELLPLPSGIGVQTICNCYSNSAGQRTTDGYLDLGVILFDGHGRIIAQNYGISQYSKLITSCGLKGDYPDPTQSLFYGVQSQFGLVVFQREAFVSQNFPTADPSYFSAYGNQSTAYTSGSPSQSTEENWLDTNATPLLLNRFTGTLIKAE